MAHKVQRKIKRADRRDDAARHAQRESQLFAASGITVQRNRLAVNPFGLLRRSHNGFDATACFSSPFGDDFSFFPRDDLAQLLVPSSHDVGGLAQNSPAVIAGELGHDLGPALRETQGSLHVAAIRPGYGVYHRVVVRVSDFNLVGLINPLTFQKYLHRQIPPGLVHSKCQVQIFNFSFCNLQFSFFFFFVGLGAEKITAIGAMKRGPA